jgi:OHCU decarboxylase
VTLAELNGAPTAEVVAAFCACAASERWVNGLVARRPYASIDGLLATAGALWRELGPNDWLEAMNQHPRIGERSDKSATRSAAWSAAEQFAVEDADRLALAQANRDYEAQFGHIFLISAAGKTSREILAALHRRMKNTADVELAIAGEELGKIALSRLAKLLGSPT